MNNRYNNVLEAIGNTPLIRLNNIAKDISATVYAKVEAFNPGLSAKDRIALYMIEEAERTGELKPGDTIVEATSGNTGFSIAMICAVKGYKCVLTVTSKVSKEKVNLLKAMGAKVIICPKSVKPDDPRSYYKRAEQLSLEIKNAYYLNQNYNRNNIKAHYLSTGKEIWEQTEGKITHLIASTGTGGTLCGTALYLKEKNPDINIIAVDAYGSVLKKYHETGIYDENEIYSYRIEGTGKNIIPANVDFDVIDEFIKVTDEESAFTTRDLALTEGLLVGYSSGAVVQAGIQLKDRFSKDDVVVMIFADHGSRYLGKVFNDEWMRDQGFMEEVSPSQPASLYGIRIIETARIKSLYESALRWTKIK